jgi:hypothetical protein
LRFSSGGVFFPNSVFNLFFLLAAGIFFPFVRFRFGLGPVKHWNQQRVCIRCSELFLPDRRNRYHQQFCNQPECRQASKAQSQKRWLKENRDYFRGRQHVERVQAWRKAHPGYGQRAPTKSVSALQEGLPLDLAPHQGVAAERPAQPLAPLQDVCLPLQDVWIRNPLMAGMISHLFDCTLQEDIEQTARRLVVKGMDILGTTPGAKCKTNSVYDTKETPPSRTPAANPGAVQLAGSPSGAG